MKAIALHLEIHPVVVLIVAVVVCMCPPVEWPVDNSSEGYNYSITVSGNTPLNDSQTLSL